MLNAKKKTLINDELYQPNEHLKNNMEEILVEQS
jgi:hypothetical protein